MQHPTRSQPHPFSSDPPRSPKAKGSVNHLLAQFGRWPGRSKAWFERNTSKEPGSSSLLNDLRRKKPSKEPNGSAEPARTRPGTTPRTSRAARPGEAPRPLKRRVGRRDSPRRGGRTGGWRRWTGSWKMVVRVLSSCGSSISSKFLFGCPAFFLEEFWMLVGEISDIEMQRCRARDSYRLEM